MVDDNSALAEVFEAGIGLEIHTSVPAVPTFFVLLEDGTSRVLQEDGTSKLNLQSAP